MRRYVKSRSELMAILSQCLDNNPECGEVELHAMRVYQPDHTGCNWSAEVDVRQDTFNDLAQKMAAARSIIVVMREQYNVLQ